LGTDRKTSILTSRLFKIYKDSDITGSKEDMAILDKNLIEAGQDDDIDTDDEIMENALNSCYTDLYKAEKSITHYNGTLMLSRLRNYSIFNRVSRPDYFDRNGIYREPKEEEFKRPGKMSPIMSQQVLESKNSCFTEIAMGNPQDTKQDGVRRQSSCDVWEQPGESSDEDQEFFRKQQD
jgi:hypothetical protein